MYFKFRARVYFLNRHTYRSNSIHYGVWYYRALTGCVWISLMAFRAWRSRCCGQASFHSCIGWDHQWTESGCQRRLYMVMSDLTHRSLACKAHLNKPIENALYKYIIVHKAPFDEGFLHLKAVRNWALNIIWWGLKAVLSWALVDLQYTVVCNNSTLGSFLFSFFQTPFGATPWRSVFNSVENPYLQLLMPDLDIL